ncbi:hypothetical protein Phum_PHUM586680 [Pediculus humanus corporis]|uniref:Uncharacterized protein n=1 Tax=Pediculus humanus subsp. corporis TaxID=121224 RepID=E0W284_PEDHC|nr:uncharacterized protein Phum_PHUM586680 [Pediculus humanus corporis]EEB19740.1 hypothetical protein Phum_PHUM586680 [Pediculus humanus corporis]
MTSFMKISKFQKFPVYYFYVGKHGESVSGSNTEWEKKGNGKENGEWIRIEDENVDVWEVTIGFGNQLIRLPVRQLLLDFNKTSPEVTFSDVTLANRMT